MSYNYHMIAYTDITEMVTPPVLKNLKEQIDRVITFDEHYTDIYPEAYLLDCGFYFWRSEDCWYLGYQLLTMKDSEAVHYHEMVKQMQRASEKLEQRTGKELGHKEVFYKYGSEGNPLVVEN